MLVVLFFVSLVGSPVRCAKSSAINPGDHGGLFPFQIEVIKVKGKGAAMNQRRNLRLHQKEPKTKEGRREEENERCPRLFKVSVSPNLLLRTKSHELRISI